MPDPAAAAAETASIRKLRLAERPAVVDSLARAFYDDPIFNWILRDDARRLEQLRRAIRLFGERIWFEHDEVYTTDSVVGGACWLPPGKWRLPFFEELSLAPPLARIMGRDGLPRFLRAVRQSERRHPEKPHYYLAMIGVAPEWQGKGMGTALMRPALERCDREGTPAYLEASSNRSRVCYERSGFTVTEEVPLPGGGPSWWAMWREPAAS
jgi:GNAT superfamily N-acetyltransferase